jgi:acetyl-CoA synthetase
MSDTTLYPVTEHFKATAAIDLDRYKAMYAQSVDAPDTFWAEQANQFLTWQAPWSQVTKSDLHKGDVQWFVDGKLNVSVNCIDRHLPARAEQVAIIWEGDDPDEDQFITYQELHDEVCQLANALRARGVKKGDRVCIYMPMIPEATYAMLACARIGAVHSHQKP